MQPKGNCYFRLNVTPRIKKQNITYPNLDSAIYLVPHLDDVAVPVNLVKILDLSKHSSKLLASRLREYYLL